MAKKVKKISPLKVEYNKERKRIQGTFSRLKKKGFIVDEDILPKIPKRITKGSVRRLSKISIKEIYKKSKFVNPETGEIFEGLSSKTGYNEYRKSKSNEEDYPVYNIITVILNKIDSLPQTRLVYSATRKKLYYMDIEGRANVLRDIIDTGINEIGLRKLAELYTNQQGEIFNLLEEITYASDEDQVNQVFSTLAFVLNRGEFLTHRQAEQLEDLGGYYEGTPV